MHITLLALLPGFAVFAWHFGIGVLLNVALASLTAVIGEALVLKLRSRPLNSLADGTAALTGALLGLCLPPLHRYRLCSCLWQTPLWRFGE